MWNPDYPHIVVSFDYRGFMIQVDQSEFEGQPIYAAWVNHDWGCAIADPCALSRKEAVRNAKRWVDQRLSAYPT